MNTYVYDASNRTTSVLFSTREAADAWVSSMPGSFGGGFTVTQRLVMSPEKSETQSMNTDTELLDWVDSSHVYIEHFWGCFHVRWGNMWLTSQPRRSLREALQEAKDRMKALT